MKFTERRDFNLADLNKEVLQEWDKQDVFHRSISEREGCPDYVFYDGPPSANGHPGIHHVMARTIKDLFCRYKTMQGFRVERKAGWDTHGLPVELGVEKELGITKQDVGGKISVADYNEACRKSVLRYTAEWEDLTRRMGYWADMEHPYITYDNSYIETLWWLLRQLYDKGLLYKGYTIQPYSPMAGTGLSSHELNLPGCYRDVRDLTATVQFRILTPKPEMEGWGTPVFLAWTTTPWTLPSNTALCVGPKIDYLAIRTKNPYNGEPITAVMAESLVNNYFSAEGDDAYQIVGRYKGTDLVGMKYEQLMPWVLPCEKVEVTSADYVKAFAAEHPEKCFSRGAENFVEMKEAAFRVIPGDYVTTDDGTGIVHIAPTFGADDAKVARDAGVPGLNMVNKLGEMRPMVDFTGKFFLTEDLAEEFVERCVVADDAVRHAGEYVKNHYDPKFYTDNKLEAERAQKEADLNVTLCVELKQQGKAVKTEKHLHNYPHCWRTDTPILYYPLDSWFIRSTALKERMSELNETIKWKPASTGTGRFGKWLENLNDWNLSRSRYWGTPLPIWRNRHSREEICIGSIEELYAEIDRSVEAGLMTSNPLRDKGFVPGDYSKENYERIDLHRPYVDDIVLVSKTGQPLRREADLIDVWFDSGAMPYAQVHYPFENKDVFERGELFPADFIAEGVDQTRGWFYTLHAIATMVFDSVAFKNVISNGLVLDKNGLKMSKRLGNAVDPFEAIGKYGSDPLRWYMITNAQPWDNLKFDEEGVKDTSRTFFAKLHQTYSFFAMYANVDGFSNPSAHVAAEDVPEIDRWIISVLNSLVRDVVEALDDYDPTRAGRLVATFVIDNLSNWYVRLNRKRFWAGDLTHDKLSAYKTLWTCLETVSRLMAPIAPFFADRLYRDLHDACGDGADSVHLAPFPKADASLIDASLEERMDLAQKISSLALSLRKKEHIIVRQPLSRICIPATDAAKREAIEAVKPLILSEVNVKELEFVEGDMIQKSLKCNFRVMGKKFGKRMKAVAAAVEALDQAQISSLETEGKLLLTLPDGDAEIERDDVEVLTRDLPGWSVVSEGALTVALDITLTPELVREGMAREIVKRIQTYRKEAGFDIVDHIRIVLEDRKEVREAVESFHTYIASQVLADSIEFAADVEGGTEFDFEDFKLKGDIRKN